MKPFPICSQVLSVVCMITGLFCPLKGEAPDVTVTDKIAAASKTTPKAPLFEYAKAPLLPSLEAVGFAAEPSYIDMFDSGWIPGKRGWIVANWPQNGTRMLPRNVNVGESGILTQTVAAGQPFRGGSMQSTREFSWGRWIARVKPSAVPGVINSVFTKDWDNLTTPENNADGDMSEVDIEFVTKTFGPGRGEVHLAIHLKGYSPFWHIDVPLDFNPSDDFHEWGFDIFPDRVVWHVDGRVLHTWEYTAEHRIGPNYEFFMNSWTKVQWVGGPPEKDATYSVDWVKFYPIKLTR